MSRWQIANRQIVLLTDCLSAKSRGTVFFTSVVIAVVVVVVVVDVIVVMKTRSDGFFVFRCQEMFFENLVRGKKIRFDFCFENLFKPVFTSS